MLYASYGKAVIKEGENIVKQEKEIIKTVKFNYCNRFILHFIWFGLTLAGFIYFIFIFRNWLKTVGIEPNGYYISDWWFEHKAVFIFVIFAIPCIAYCVIFLLSMVIAVCTQNKKGSCVFYREFFELTAGRKKRINYEDIKSITYTPIFTSVAYLGRKPHKLVINTKKRKVKIHMSLKESWFNRKNDITLEVLYKEIKKKQNNFKKIRTIE
jgi:hypothetical protein